MKIVIVGGVAGGATAAARLRRNSEADEIVLIEKGAYISYANCGLPYYIGGVIAERGNLFVQTPESFAKRFAIDVRTQSEVIDILRQEKKVVIRKTDGSTYEESYDKLLLSPGAKAIAPPLKGIDNERIVTLRNVPDTDRIKNLIDSKGVKRAVIVGGGFIGLEMAENLIHTGVDVSVVEMANQVMAQIDYSMAAFVHRHLCEKGVKLYLEEAVEAFEESGNALQVCFHSGKSIGADLVLLSIGVRAETALAEKCGLEIGVVGGIKVNAYLQTSDESIYAVGDAIEFPHPLTGKPWLNYLAGPANRQARIVADNLSFGPKIMYEGSIGTAIAKVFDLTVATTGLPAKRLKQLGIPYQSATIHTNAHAGYYPGATVLDLKITFSPADGKLYGAQIVGYEGVDKRIDALAAVIKRGGSIYDLMETEHAYAPPFSSAKDPIAIIGYVANNIISGKMKPAYWREIAQLNPLQTVLVDVRTPEEFALRAIDGAVNIPVDELRDRLAELPRDKELILYCGVGLRGYLASNILLANGFERVRNLVGGIKTYETATDISYLKHGVTDSNNGTLHVSGKLQPVVVNACGLQCPGPIMKLREVMTDLPLGGIVEFQATDAGFLRDVEAWCKSTGNRLIDSFSEKGIYHVKIQKEKGEKMSFVQENLSDGKTFILFSDDLDKTLATFVLANGAAATDKKVSIFFTFWGLNAIKKEQSPKVDKDIYGKMFGWMLPENSRKLALSKMHMLGIGSRMIRYVMKRKGVASLEDLRQQALQSGVEFIACQMSMDVMGIKKEELLDGVTIGGVATYMNRAENANVNLFI